MTFLISSILPEAPGLFGSIEISGLELDSRNIKNQNLFVALKGCDNDGADFIPSAIKMGAAAVVSDSDVATKYSEQVPVLVIEDLRQRLGSMANLAFVEPSKNLHLIGITGTNGKTSVAQFVAQLYQNLIGKSAFIGTTGQGLWGSFEKTDNTTPDILSLNKALRDFVNSNAKACAMEVSSHGLDQGRVDSLLFKTAVFTNLSRDHLDYHKTMEAYALAKSKLFEFGSLTNRVINIDDTLGAKLAQKYENSNGLITVSSLDKSADLYLSNIGFSSEGIRFDICYQGQSIRFDAPLYGRFNVFNISLAIGVMLAEGIDLIDLVEPVRNIQPVTGRMQPFLGDQKPVLIVDYAHTPDALEKALTACRDHVSGKLWCVFGCGGDRDAGKRPEMAKIAEDNSQVVVVTDDNPRSESSALIIEDIMQGFKLPESVVAIPDREQAIRYAFSQAANDDVILVAGKGHEEYQIIGDQKIHYSDLEIAEALTGGGK